MNHVFDSFVADTSTLELRSEDKVIPIEGKVFDLLCFLIENNDHVVSKDELVQSIWDGRVVSDAAISSAVSALRRALGDDGKDQRFVKTVHGRGFRFIAPVVQLEKGSGNSIQTRSHDIFEQRIHFCRSKDDTQIAYATAGSGPPLLKISNWLSHLEYDWESPVWKHVFKALVQDCSLIRYDVRGNGLSDWFVEDFSIDRHIEDLEAVVDAAGLEKFTVLGFSQGCIRAVAYAAKYPEKVGKLILIGGYVRGWKLRDNDPDGQTFNRAASGMIGRWWGKENPAIRQLFTNIFLPKASEECQRWYTDFLRKTITPESASSMMFAGANDDISRHLPKIVAPTLVIHAHEDLAAHYDQSRELAAGIKGAKFASLNTSNHLLPETDPAWQECSELIMDFLSS